MDSLAAKRLLRLANGLANELNDIVWADSAADGPAARTVASSTPPSELYDALIDDQELISTTRGLFTNGHCAQSVEEAFKYINNLVKQRTGLASDGADLMNRAFSLNAPLLRLSELRTQSQKDQQTGYMMMLGGAMTGVRNPRAHQHRHLDDPHAALELLCFANHLARQIRIATRTRRRRS